MKRFGLLLLAIFAVAGATNSTTPSSAELLTKAEKQATTEHKNVMVIFHATWCGWCKKLDAFLADEEMGKAMNDSFVIVHLDVMESDPVKKQLENAGGQDLMKQWNGEQAGLPFTVILDPHGKKLADSNLTDKQPSNIGYPAKPEEIAHFMKMLQFAPQLTTDQRTRVQSWLTAHAPKSG